jgi:DNA replication protein DnaC
LGTGKSAAAAWLATKFDGTFVSCPDLSMAFGFDDSARRLMEKYKNVNFLIIDDLGTEYADKNGFFDQGFGNLMNARYSNMLRTVVTTNVPPEELAKRYPHFIDRLREDGAVYVIVSESMRGKDV